MALKSNLHVLQNLAQLIIRAMVTAIGCRLLTKVNLHFGSQTMISGCLLVHITQSHYMWFTVWFDSVCLEVYDMTCGVWHDSWVMTWLVVYDMTCAVWHDSWSRGVRHDSSCMTCLTVWDWQISLIILSQLLVVAVVENFMQNLYILIKPLYLYTVSLLSISLIVLISVHSYGEYCFVWGGGTGKCKFYGISKPRQHWQAYIDKQLTTSLTFKCDLRVWKPIC